MGARLIAAMQALPVGPHRVEDMVKYCLETAQRMLEKNGAFFPWGAVIDNSGERKLVIGENSPATATATAAQAYALLEQAMGTQYRQGQIVAGAIVAEASVPPELKPDFPDAIRVVVESSTISRLIFLPFRRGAAGAAGEATRGALEFGELIGVNVRHTVFAA